MNIHLVPRVISEINSRDEIDIGVDFCGIRLAIPIIASPMVDVCNGRVAKIMYDSGAYGIIHRFNTIENQLDEFSIADKNAGCAIGLQDGVQRFLALYQAGCRIFCIDTANGANINVKKLLNEIENISISQKYNQDYHMIIGNVASEFCYTEISSWTNVSGVRLLIGSGTACETTKATGIYNNPISLLQECADSASSKLKIIDGGIKEPGDFCKVIGCGADAIMIGSLIAQCHDSCARTKLQVSAYNKSYKEYRGSSSFEIQNLYKEPKYIEGTSTLLLESSETIAEMLQRFSNGLKSCCSYFNVRNLQEFRKNISYYEC